MDLSIIIISSKKDFLFNCLESLVPSLEGVDAEIILIDNASEDAVGSLAKEKYPEIKVIRRESNGGFGENNNLGIKVAKGKYILLLNDDTVIIEKNIFKEMISWMDAHPKAGVAGCALLNSDRRSLQGSGGFYPNLWRVFAWMTFLDDIPLLDKLIKPYHPMHSGSPLYKGETFFEKPHRQDWITGAFYLMRREALEDVGMFDEDFFLYVEEVDLSARFIKKGWEVWYLPKWKIVHLGSATTGSEKSIIYEFQNLLLMYKKHEAGRRLPILRWILKFGAFLRYIIWGAAGKKDVSKIYAKAFKSI